MALGIESDSFGFLMAMEEYSLARFQPHFPGYPLYIFAGRLATFLFGSPPRGLLFLNLSFSLLLLLPFSLVARRIFSRNLALFLSLLLILSPSWIATLFKISPEPMAAFFLLLSFYFSILLLRDRGGGNGSIRWNEILSGLFSGLAIGVKPDYFPFLFSFFVLRRWSRGGSPDAEGESSWRLPLAVSLLVCCLCLTGQLLVVGVPEYLYHAVHFSAGHFSRWGGSILTHWKVHERISSLLLEGLLYKGFGPGALLVGAGIVIGIMEIARSEPGKEKASDLTWRALLLYPLPYLIWVFLAQNLRNPRHLYPLLPFVLLFAARAMVRLLERRGERRLLPGAVGADSQSGQGTRRAQRAGSGQSRRSAQNAPKGQGEPGFAARLAFFSSVSLALVALFLFLLSFFLMLPSLSLPSPQVQAALYFRTLRSREKAILFASWAGKVFEYVAPEVLPLHPEEVDVEEMAQEAMRQGYTCYLTSPDIQCGERFHVRKVRSFWRDPLLQDAYPSMELFQMISLKEPEALHFRDGGSPVAWKRHRTGDVILGHE